MPPSWHERWAWTVGSGPCLDTDIVLKCSAWSMADVLPRVVGHLGPPAVLGLVHLIAPRQLGRMGLAEPEAARGELDRILGSLGRMEPSDEEIGLAAELAALAQEADLPLDTGEAQLTAITILRDLPLLVTGDKRAIRALAQMRPAAERLGRRLACLEQVIEAVVAMLGPDEARDRICREPAADSTMRLVFSCHGDARSAGHAQEALASYIGDIRRGADGLLIDGSLLA